MPAIQHFLLVFDHGQRRLLKVQEFGSDLDAASEAYTSVEAENRENPLIDIVLVGSDSLDSVRVTHSTYFDATEPDVFSGWAGALSRAGA